MTEPLSSLRAASVPERPSLDGLEDKWAAYGRQQGTYAFDREAALAGPRRRSSRSTPRRRRPPARCTWATSSATPTPTASRATSGWPASTSSTRSAGTTTACPPRSGCRTTTACAATRASPRPGLRAALHAATPRAPRPPTRCRSPGRTSSSCATSSPSRRGGLRVALPPHRAQLRLVDHLPHHRRPLAGHRPAGVPAQPRPRRGLPGRGAGPVGRHVPDRGGPGRARGPRLPRPLPPGRLPRPDRRRCTSRPPAPS